MTVSALPAIARLSAEQLTSLRALLLSELADRTQQRIECRRVFEELTGQSDPDSLLERELAEASAAHCDAAVFDVERALWRLDDGAYGLCDGCGAEIPFERLEAIPHSRLCVRCVAAPRRPLV